MTLPEAIVYLLDEFSIGDCVYAVRDKAATSSDGFNGNSWDHPDVVKFGEACKALEEARPVKQINEMDVPL